MRGQLQGDDLSHQLLGTQAGTRRRKGVRLSLEMSLAFAFLPQQFLEERGGTGHLCQEGRNSLGP